MGPVVLLDRQRKPVDKNELMLWCRNTAEANGTLIGGGDMRTYMELFLARVEKQFGVKIEERETQQLSKQRAAVNVSGIRQFSETVNTLLQEKPALRKQGLKATGGWDETKVDLNKLLQAASLVPEGGEVRWEVEAERCVQITFLIGFMGYRDEEPDGTGLPRNLTDVKRLIAEAKSDAELDAALDGISEIGSIVGFPKLEPGFWDSDDFCILPGLLIFEGVTGADPAWLNLVHDKNRLTIATTESGFINTDTKFQWYKHIRAQPYVPFGKRPTIPQADNHISNESIAMSEMMEVVDEAHLIGPNGHSTHLTAQLDQTGGPNQRWKRVFSCLVRHMYRIRGSLCRPRICRVAELATVLSFTPALCSASSRRVGWSVTESGELFYEPLNRPHIVNQLFHDEPLPGAAGADAVTPAATVSNSARMAVLNSSSGPIEAAKETARQIFGNCNSKNKNDGWSDEEDAEEAGIAEAGARKRRKGVPSGRVVASEEFRADKRAQQFSMQAVELKAVESEFKKFRTNVLALGYNAEAEAELAKLADGQEVADAKLSNDQLIGFIRARTKEPIPSDQKSKPALLGKVTQLRAMKPQLTLGTEPEGYGAWNLKQQAAAAEKQAAKQAAKQALVDTTGAGVPLLLPPTIATPPLPPSTVLPGTAPTAEALPQPQSPLPPATPAEEDEDRLADGSPRYDAPGTEEEAAPRPPQRRQPRRNHIDQVPMQQLQSFRAGSSLGSACNNSNTLGEQVTPSSPGEQHRTKARRLLRMAEMQTSPNSKALLEELAQAEFESADKGASRV